ncbi:M23 family peptidase, partial [Escherichia coli]
MRLKHIILTTCLFSSTLAMAELPQDSRRPGGIAVIPLTSDITQVTFQHKPVLISQEGQQRYAVFGIPLSTPLGSVQLDTNKAPIQIEVKSYPYAEQRLKVTNQDYV